MDPFSGSSIRPITPSDPAVHAVRTEWRRLTGGGSVRDGDRRTLIACSGGADSTALVLALAGVQTKPVIAHILHDMRPQAEARRDRDAVRGLADSLGLGFVQATVSIRESGENHESIARTLRYDALARLATEQGIRWIATGHHADDQLETLLMRLIRGTGPEGLAGIHDSRPIGDRTLIRPMLTVTHQDSVTLCKTSGASWCEDVTNQNTERLRAALRTNVLPVLEELSPGSAARVAQTAKLQAELVRVLQDAIAQLVQLAKKPSATNLFVLDRDVLRASRPVVLSGLIRELTGKAGRDRRGKAVLDQVLAAVCDHEQRTREFSLGGAEIRVLPDSVQISPADR